MSDRKRNSIFAVGAVAGLAALLLAPAAQAELVVPQPAASASSGVLVPHAAPAAPAPIASSGDQAGPGDSSAASDTPLQDFVNGSRQQPNGPSQGPDGLSQAPIMDYFNSLPPDQQSTLLTGPPLLRNREEFQTREEWKAYVDSLSSDALDMLGDLIVFSIDNPAVIVDNFGRTNRSTSDVHYTADPRWDDQFDPGFGTPDPERRAEGATVVDDGPIGSRASAPAWAHAPGTDVDTSKDGGTKSAGADGGQVCPKGNYQAAVGQVEDPHAATAACQ